MASGKAATTAVFTAAILHWTHIFPDTAHHISQLSNTLDIPHQPQSDTPPMCSTHPSVAYQRRFFGHHWLPRAAFQPWLCYAFLWGATPLFRLHTPSYWRWVNSVTRGLCILSLCYFVCDIHRMRWGAGGGCIWTCLWFAYCLHMSFDNIVDYETCGRIVP